MILLLRAHTRDVSGMDLRKGGTNEKRFFTLKTPLSQAA